MAKKTGTHLALWFLIYQQQNKVDENKMHILIYHV